ncbi:MAG: aldo/keto reductase [Verrucomicrobia bacterium]|nr:aldo/keto reductase [Verrucomicrobiota bacterium]
MTVPMLNTRSLGSTGLRISEISFGAGPVAALMTSKARGAQLKTIRRALEVGINWFDTAATYGDGHSETNLGAALRELGALEKVHIATKVRLTEQQLGNVGEAVKSSVAASLKRLGVPRITLIQLHNSITPNRGDQPTSITPRDVLRKASVLDAFLKLKADGIVENFGLTGLGDGLSIREVIAEGDWTTLQVPFHILGPRRSEGDWIATCAQRGIAVLAIRVFAGGALVGQPPSAHTLQTKFFPLELYQRDQHRAAQLAALLPPGTSLKEASIRYVLGDAQISTALIGFAGPEQLDEAVGFAQAGPLPPALLENLFA